MTSVLAKLYDKNNALLGELPDFANVQIQDKLNDENGWTMKYDRGGINSGLLIQDQDLAVKFFLDGAQIFEGMVEEDNYDEIDEDQDLTIAGRSQAGMFEYAKVYPKAGVGSNTAAEHGFITTTPGKIFRTLFALAQGRGGLPGFTVTFTDTHDSAGQAWSSTLTIAYKAGVSLLEILKNFGTAGYADWRMNGKALNMYNPRTILGGQANVTFRRGRDITAAPRSRSRRKLGTVYLVQGDEDVTVERTDGSAVSARGRREQFISQGGIKDTGTLNVIGDLQLLTYSNNRLSKTHKITFSSDQEVYNAQPKPWVNYIPGQYVNTDLTGTVENYRMVAMTITLGVEGVVEGEVTLNDIFMEREVLVDDAIQSLTGGSASGGASTTKPIPAKDKTIPKAPVGLSGTSYDYVTREGDKYAQATITWANVTENTDDSAFDDFQRYEFRWWYTAIPGEYFTIDASDNLVNFSALEPGEQITSRVRAWDSNGHASAWSSDYTMTLADDQTPPPVPSMPQVTNWLGTLRAEWNGKGSGGEDMPLDFRHVQVWYSTINNFTPGDTNTFLADYLPAKGAAIISGLAYGTPYFVKFVAVDKLGNASAPSVQGSGTPQQVVKTDIGNNVIDFSNIRFKDMGNLIPDGSFELQATRDLINSVTSQYKIAVVTNPSGATAAPSPWVLECQNGGAFSYVVTSDINVTPGQKIAMIFSHRSQNLVAGDLATIQLQYKLADGTLTYQPYKTWNETTNSPTWVMREAAVFAVPANAVTMNVLVRSNILSGATARVWIDQWEVRFQAGTVLIEDAAITNAKIATLAVNDANIANLNVSKLITGTLGADIVVGSRIKTADTGARVELNSGGLGMWNSSGVQTVAFAASNGSASIIGQLRSGPTGRRIEINPTSTYLPEIRFYPTTGSNYGFLNAVGGGADVSVGLNSGTYNEGEGGVSVTNRLYMGPDFANLEVVRNSDQSPYGGQVHLSSTTAFIGRNKGTLGDTGVDFYNDGKARFTGEISNWGSNQCMIIPGNTTWNDGPFAAVGVAYGATQTSTPRVLAQLNDEISASGWGVGCNVQDLTTSGFTAKFTASSAGASGSVHYWAFRL